MRKKTGLSLFWRCFITYCICAVLFIAVLLYSYQQLSSLWQTSYLNQTSDDLASNSRKLSDSLYSTSTVPKILQATDYFYNMTIKDSLDAPQDSYYISRTMETIGTLKGINYLNWEVLIYMKRPGIFLTNTRVYRDPEILFSDVYKYETLSPAEEINMLSAPKLRILPEDCISINGKVSSPYITCLLNETGDSCVWLFLIPKSRILELFQVSSLPGGSLFELRGKDGTLLVSYGEEIPGKSYLELSSGIQSTGGTVHIRIPEDFLKLSARKTLSNILYIFAGTMVLGLFLCYFFSRFNAKPVKELLEHQQIPMDELNRNELISLDSYLSTSKAHQVQMKQQLQSNLLICAFFGIPVDEQELKEMLDQNLLFDEPTRIAILRQRRNTDDTETGSQAMFDLKERLSDNFVVVPVNRQELGILFPDENDRIPELKKSIDDTNSRLDTDSQIVCGVSAPFTGCSNISNAVQQAMFHIPSAEESLVIFSAANNEAPDNHKIPDIKAFRNALFNWNREEVSRLLIDFSEAVRQKSPSSAQQIFYTLLSSIKDSAAVIQVPTDIFDECTFAKSISAAANIRALQKLVDYLFEKKAISRKNHKDEQIRDILDYLKEHAGDANMSVTALSERFGRSERVINALVIKATGQSVPGYLLQLRMQLASELLRDSELDVNVIAERCGMTPSTFYRNYKKFFHMTPTEYKENLEHMTEIPDQK